MARPPRIDLQGYPHHIVVRGNNRDRIFVEQSDYQVYLEKLAVLCDRYECDLHAYVLMTNHVHLLITPRAKNAISRFMHALSGGYALYFNARHSRTGTLWEGRYRISVVDSDFYFFACHRYIEMNPVRAGLVSSAHHYRWSSYRHNALCQLDPLVTHHSAYNALGDTPATRSIRYREFFRESLSDETLQTIRDSTQSGVRLGTAQSDERTVSGTPGTLDTSDQQLVSGQPGTGS